LKEVTFFVCFREWEIQKEIFKPKHAGGGFLKFNESLENTRSTNADKAAFLHYLQVLQLG